MRTALLFPGQGAPAGEWRDAVSSHRPDLLALAQELLDLDPFERFGTGTEVDQPAIYCASLAAFELRGRPASELHAGHSLGEISALACAGWIGDEDGLRLVVERGRLMADAAEQAGAGAMLAVGAPADELAELVAGPELSVANLNSPSQTVLSGAEPAVLAAAEQLRERGFRTKRLAVSGAFHSQAMAPAAEAFAGVLAGIELAEPAVTVISSRTAAPFVDPRAELAASLLEPVRWIDVVTTLERERIERCFEVGPGRALSVLVRRCSQSGIETEPTRLPETAGA